MDYYFNGSVNTMSTRFNNDLTLLFNNGAALLSYTPNFSNPLEYKMELDQYASNQARNYDLGGFYGYSFYFDNELRINLNNKCTYFALGLRDNVHDISLNSYFYDDIDAGQFHYYGYNNQLLSPIENFTINSGDNTTNYYFYDSYYDLTMVFTGSNPNTFSNLFDYRLSSHKDTYYVRGEDYYFYTGEFVIDCPDSTTLVITSGFDSSLNQEYERGFTAGLEKGTVEGRQQGYQNGLRDGISQGKLESGDYSSAMSFIGTGAQQLMPIFGLELLPNITLGTLISIPIVVGLITIIFRISKG